MRAYLDELEAAPDESNWPPAWNPELAAPLRADLARVLAAVLDFAKDSP